MRTIDAARYNARRSLDISTVCFHQLLVVDPVSDTVVGRCGGKTRKDKLVNYNRYIDLDFGSF
jgi:hypothetical protein